MEFITNHWQMVYYIIIAINSMKRPSINDLPMHALNYVERQFSDCQKYRYSGNLGNFKVVGSVVLRKE